MIFIAVEASIILVPILVVVYLQCFRGKKIVTGKAQRSEITTLFDGEK